MTDYPECDKLLAVKDESNVIGAFLDHGPYELGVWQEEADAPRWIDSRTGEASPELNGYAIENPEWSPAGFYPVRMSIERVLAEYFKIDLDKVEAERRQMLEELRAANAS